MILKMSEEKFINILGRFCKNFIKILKKVVEYLKVNTKIFQNRSFIQKVFVKFVRIHPVSRPLCEIMKNM